MEIDSAVIDPLWRGAVEEINRLHEGIISRVESSIEDGIRIGEILIQVKGALKHGEWIPWLASHVPFSRTMAWYYLESYERQDEIRAKCLTVKRFGYRLLLNSENGNTPDKPQKLHEPNFYLGEFRLRQTFVGDFYRYLQRKPLNLWDTEEISDFLALISGFDPIIDELRAELKSRSHELVAG